MFNSEDLNRRFIKKMRMDVEKIQGIKTEEKESGYTDLQSNIKDKLREDVINSVEKKLKYLKNIQHNLDETKLEKIEEDI